MACLTTTLRVFPSSTTEILTWLMLFLLVHGLPMYTSLQPQLGKVFLQQISIWILLGKWHNVCLNKRCNVNILYLRTGIAYRPWLNINTHVCNKNRHSLLGNERKNISCTNQEYTFNLVTTNQTDQLYSLQRIPKSTGERTSF